MKVTLKLKYSLHNVYSRINFTQREAWLCTWPLGGDVQAPETPFLIYTLFAWGLWPPDSLPSRCTSLGLREGPQTKGRRVMDASKTLDTGSVGEGSKYCHCSEQPGGAGATGKALAPRLCPMSLP